MRYVSVCSGIEAATVAWHPLGWRPAAFAEIAKFPSQVLAHHYPEVPNVGDFTTEEARRVFAAATPFDILVGGTPCQSFSVAGLRGGLSDARGNLALEFARLADRFRPRWVVWENVPGVLSSNGGRDFGSILGALVELGYGVAYRVLDAQFIGVPQRRRRVFLVGYLGDWRRAAAVLFERTSMRRDTPKGGATGEAVAGTLGAGVTGGFGGDLDRHGAFNRDEGPVVVGTLCNNGKAAGSATQQDAEAGLLLPVVAFDHQQGSAMNVFRDRTPTLRTQRAPVVGILGDVAHTLTAEGFDASEDGTGRGPPVIAFSAVGHGQDAGELAPTLRSGHDRRTGHTGAGAHAAIAFDPTQITSKTNRSQPAPGLPAPGLPAPGLPAPTLARGAHPPAIAFHMTQDPISGAVSPALGTTTTGMGVAHAVTCHQAKGGDPTTDNYAVIGGGVASRYRVRRLTPRECERLQGFPDDYTLIPPKKISRAKLDADAVKYLLRSGYSLSLAEQLSAIADGPRYKALGNSMAVTVMRWIGRRIAYVDAL